MARWKDTRGASPLLVIVALLLIAGFLYWLNWQAQGMERDVEPVASGEEGELADLVPAQLVDAPGSLLGEQGVLRNVGVSRSLGRGVVTLDLDGENQYPVLLHPDIIARGTTLSTGERIPVYGTVYALNDSIRGAWVERQAVDQGNAGEIPGTESFVLADSLTFN